MTSPEPSRELAELVAAVADGIATPEEESRLAELLKADPSARAYYLSHTELVADLHWEYAYAATTPVAPVMPRSRRPSLRRIMLYAASLCAALLVGVSLSVVLRPAKVLAATPPPPAVLVQTEQADWAELADGSALSVGSALPTEAVRLRSGVATVRFECGAVLTATGPAEFHVLSGRSVSIRAGRVSLRCDDGSIGFQVRTPASDFVDLGTEFAVIVAEDGSTDVRVAEGTVIARPQASELIVPLHQGEAARVDFRRGEVLSIDADPVRFQIGQAGPVVAPPPRRADDYPPLPAGARVVFLGDHLTDRETHILLVNQAMAGVPGRPLFFNAGETFPLHFTEADFDRVIRPLRPTHAVVEFGSDSASAKNPSSPSEFHQALTRLLDRLRNAKIEPILELGHPLGVGRKADQERLDEFNRHIRELAAQRRLRVIDPRPRFKAADEAGVGVLTPNGRSPTFAGYRLLAEAVLDGLGFPNRALPEAVPTARLPGVISDWRRKLQPAGGFPLTAEEAAAIRPDDTWRSVTLPLPPDPFQMRLADRNHSIAYRDRLRGYFSGVRPPAGGSVLAVAEVHSDAERNAWLNTGGGAVVVWLNGEKIHETSRWTGWHAGKERYPVRLKAGKNTLLVEAKYDFFVGITDTGDWPIPTSD